MNEALHRLFWRLHFWAGLLCAPIVVFAALTGLLYACSPQIEAWRHARLDHVPVPAVAARQSLDAQVSAAQAAYPGESVSLVVPAWALDGSTQVHLRASHAHHGMEAGASAGHDHGLPSGRIVYVNPYTTHVLGALPQMGRFKTWAKKLHSSALQGDGWRWVMELGASWMLVLSATGLALWWPQPQARGGRGLKALRPRWARGRVTWRDLHALVAIAFALVTAVVLVTGLTWARHSGANFRALQTALGQNTPRPPASLRSAASPEAPFLGWQAVLDRARARAPAVALQLTPPRDEHDVWRIESIDRSQPRRAFTLAIDAYTGQTLFERTWTQWPPLAQATAVGIAFHRGEFGLWNQWLLALTALAALFSVASGVMMWWQRRSGSGLASAPPLRPGMVRRVPAAVWAWLLPLTVALGLALPVFGWSVLALLGLEATRLLWPLGRGAGHA